MDPDVLIAARGEFAKSDPVQMAKLSESEYLPDRQVIRLKYLNAVYEVSFPDGRISGDRAGGLTQSEEALLLQYLSQACGATLADRWMAFAELPHGMLHDAPFRAVAIEPLVKIFEQQPQLLIRVAGQLGGHEIKLAGDICVVIPVFPRITVAVSLWLGDEEFPTKANILFDAAAPKYLSTSSLYVLGTNLSEHLKQAAGQE